MARDKIAAWHPIPQPETTTWAWYLVPCPNVIEAKAALNGAVFLLTQAENWDSTVGDIEYSLKRFSEVFRYMTEVTQIFEDMLAEQTRMADAQELIAANLQASDGEGGFIGIGKILFDLLPVLIGSSDNLGQLTASVGFMNTWGTLLAGSVADDTNANNLINQLGALADLLCCEPQPTKNGLVALPPTCLNALQFVSNITMSSGNTASQLPNGNYHLEFGPDTQTIIELDLSLNHPDWDIVVQWFEENDVDNLIKSYRFGSVGDFINPIPVPLFVPEDAQLLSFALEYPDGGSGAGGELIVTACEPFDVAKPIVLIDLKSGIGELGHGWIESAGIWAINPPQIEPSVSVPLTIEPDAIQLDWTRPINGTLTVEFLNSEGGIIETYPIDMSQERGSYVEVATTAAKRMVVKIASLAAQQLANLIVWAVVD